MKNTNKVWHTVIGIDPGIYGGLAVHNIFSKVDSGAYPQESWQVFPLPTREYSKGRYELDLPSFVKLVKGLLDDCTGLRNFSALQTTKPWVVIEKPPMVPGNGILAYRSLFKGWGEIRGVLATLEIPFLEVDPKVWKSEILPGTAKDKAAAINFITNRYPDIELPLHPKPKKKGDKHDGIADAICLAEYGRRIQLGSNQPNE